MKAALGPGPKGESTTPLEGYHWPLGTPDYPKSLAGEGSVVSDNLILLKTLPSLVVKGSDRPGASKSLLDHIGQSGAMSWTPVLSPRETRFCVWAGAPRGGRGPFWGPRVPFRRTCPPLTDHLPQPLRLPTHLPSPISTYQPKIRTNYLLAHLPSWPPCPARLQTNPLAHIPLSIHSSLPPSCPTCLTLSTDSSNYLPV